MTIRAMFAALLLIVSAGASAERVS